MKCFRECPFYYRCELKGEECFKYDDWFPELFIKPVLSYERLLKAIYEEFDDVQEESDVSKIQL